MNELVYLIRRRIRHGSRSISLHLTSVPFGSKTSGAACSLSDLLKPLARPVPAVVSTDNSVVVGRRGRGRRGGVHNNMRLYGNNNHDSGVTFFRSGDHANLTAKPPEAVCPLCGCCARAAGGGGMKGNNSQQDINVRAFGGRASFSGCVDRRRLLADCRDHLPTRGAPFLKKLPRQDHNLPTHTHRRVSVVSGRQGRIYD